MKKKEEEKEPKLQKQADRSRLKRGVGAALIVLGVLLILSVIFVPMIIRRNNDKDIEDIRAGKYADKTEQDATTEAVSTEAVSPDAVISQAAEPDERMTAILADDTRIGIVEIPKIDVAYAILEGTEDAQINRAIGHLTESAGIGEKGNCVIAGHRGGYFGTFFQDLPDLEQGDDVILTDRNGIKYYYVVYDKKIVDPADWSVTKDLADQHTLTLITCEDDTRKRVVVTAVMYEP